jgi:hypothetical protein
MAIPLHLKRVTIRGRGEADLFKSDRRDWWAHGRFAQHHGVNRRNRHHPCEGGG